MAGRKTGGKHTNPGLSLENDGRRVVTGSGLGPAAEPQWLKHLPAEIEIGRRNLAVNVAVAAAEQRDILWKKLVSRGPFLAGYQKKLRTGRRSVGFDPGCAEDEFADRGVDAVG